jgi:hypothetical protein
MINGLEGFAKYLSEKCLVPIEVSKRIISESIRKEDSYPLGDRYEKEMPKTLNKLSSGYREIDRKVEENPVSINDLIKEIQEIPEKKGISKEEMDAVGELNKSLKKVKLTTDKKVALSNVEDLGDGAFITEYSRTIPQKIGKPCSDFIENKPISAFFVDTRPGETGLQAYYFDFELLG